MRKEVSGGEALMCKAVSSYRGSLRDVLDLIEPAAVDEAFVSGLLSLRSGEGDLERGKLARSGSAVRGVIGTDGMSSRAWPPCEA